MSVRLHLVVEGQTEETYVNRVLVPHLAAHGVWADARAVETGRRGCLVRRGGLREYARLRGDLVRWMKQDDHPDVFFTTMIDLCGLGLLRDTFPGWDEAKSIPDPYRRVAALQDGFGRDVRHCRFIPYLQLHEFEALLLASPGHLRVEFIGHDREIGELESLAASFASPEPINDGTNASPSKRIIAKLPQYAGLKATAGPIVAMKIGLAALREKCPHFAEWLSRLEKLGVET